jgi:hypothetical protein
VKEILFLALLVAGPALAAEFRAGVARTCITPPMPFWLSGYAARTSAAASVRQELWAKALALADDRGGRVVIVTADITRPCPSARRSSGACAAPVRIRRMWSESA